ncbi:hypothetical protein MMC07_004302 [Pseudocyphellaria aurata]|nr:hypothetical protein [Pseudocyphellaria aurata]
MAIEAKSGVTNKSKKVSSDGSYVLRTIVDSVPLASEPGLKTPRITCVELWEENLYVGTSAAEILHFVSIPADADDESVASTFIFASRLQPDFRQSQNVNQVLSGVQQILPLSGAKKVCILCNNTLTFYSLPELSPAFPNSRVHGCSWVGGVDLNNTDATNSSVEIIMICLKNRIRLVRIGDEPKLIRNIEFPACLAAARRDSYACVADANSYSLLDVENQQKANLFPISSLDENTGFGKIEDISPVAEPSNPKNAPSGGLGSSDSRGDARSHVRNTSIGNFVAGLGKRQESPASRSRERQGISTPEPLERANLSAGASNLEQSDPASRTSNRQPAVPDKPLPPPPDKDGAQRIIQTKPSRLSIGLRPHIVSPSASEFLLTTGTSLTEPGVGIFVNLDGDVVRGTLEFSRYPIAVVIDGSGSAQGEPKADGDGHVLAAMSRTGTTQEQISIEIQKWSLTTDKKEWLDIPVSSTSDDGSEGNKLDGYGLRAVHTANTVSFPEVGESLRASRVRLHGDQIPNSAAGRETSVLEEWEVRKNVEETKFARRLGGRECCVVAWSGSSIWWVVRNPIALRLDAAIDQALNSVDDVTGVELDRNKLIKIIESIQDHEETTETDFLSLEYIRQKISLILFSDLIMKSPFSLTSQTNDNRIIEAALMETTIDPRVILTMFPLLRDEIVEGTEGIWIHAGLLRIVERFWSAKSQPRKEKTADTNPEEMLGLLKRYLLAWRQRKGFGSIANEVEVFQTIDAAVLHLLLHLDSLRFDGSSNLPSSKADLYSIVDSGVDCFDRAVVLLEKYRRLYVLSRLYGSQRMAGKVLQTWRRIIDGERDAGDELVDGENEVRKYLVRIKDSSLVREYGTWLARRNPALGVQVYTDETSRVKYSPHQVVELLQEKAPEAVKVYLEHLVFGKKNFQYANDLISYYLDNVLSILRSSKRAQELLAQSYESYRALHPPKPTYRQFIIDNAVPEAWWHDRLRLLELLGGSHGADFSYNVASILSRIEPFEQDLVPESIILDGRQGRHQQAIRLLTHGLGDYHTAINYCLLGGASIFYPTSGAVSSIGTPTNEEQAILFGFLLGEFLRIEDVNNRLERTSELLERFGSWYDVNDVLGLIPESWSVDLISGFLVNAFRRLIEDKNEAMITKALSSAESLQMTSSFIEKCNTLGPRIETV